ncbi:TonB-dependent receptor domain-containing protein [Ramlibacter albus]|uniref:TonB-dependent receptor n=1 Tax=Ramlibacter albus TaxID=2079448 RepID=A0A923MBD4_9BURK|nr:TonB-dependent receptor [Ramlibacter albus]MBC5767697.1 TonB-dependent receptor [Ramlibacter albus]
MTIVLRMRRAALPLALAAAFTPSAFAQVATLAETVVTATRVATRADQLVSDVTVIDRAAIEAGTARTLTELLARTPGLQMTGNGGRGKQSGVFIRGAEPRHTLLLVDGVRVGSATAGIPNWETIPLEMIERIEILKGPASALYGSDGVGGVVQVFTRKGVEGFHPYAAITAGSTSHWDASGGVSGGRGGWTYSFGAQRTQEKGFNATQPYVPFGNFNADRDGFRQTAVNGSLGYRFNENWRADATVLASDGRSNYDDGAGVDSLAAIRSLAAQVGVKGRILPGWQSELSVAQGNDTNNSIRASFPGNFRTEQTQWTWQNNIDTPVGVAVAGLEHRVQDVSATTAYTVTSRTINSAFLGLNGNAGGHAWQLNARQDRNSQFGDANTWFAGYGYRFTPSWRVHASYGTSFVAPSFNQLYFPGFGNPALQPERGRNRDFGVTYTQGAHEVKLVRFDNRIRGFMTNTTLPVNIPRVRIEGWSLAYTGKVDALNLSASADSLDPRNQVSGARLPRRAKEQYTVAADYRLGAWSFGGSLLHVGSRYDDVANRIAMGSYTTADAFATWQFAKDLSVQLKLNNLADKRYETAYGYNQPGREFYATLRWQPK